MSRPFNEFVTRAREKLGHITQLMSAYDESSNMATLLGNLAPESEEWKSFQLAKQLVLGSGIVVPAGDILSREECQMAIDAARGFLSQEIYVAWREAAGIANDGLKYLDEVYAKAAAAQVAMQPPSTDVS